MYLVRVPLSAPGDDGAAPGGQEETLGGGGSSIEQLESGSCDPSLSHQWARLTTSSEADERERGARAIGRRGFRGPNGQERQRKKSRANIELSPLRKKLSTYGERSYGRGE